MNDVIAGQATRLHSVESSSESPAVKALVCLVVTAHAWWLQVDAYSRRTHSLPAPASAQIDRVIRLMRADTQRMRNQLASPTTPALPLRAVAGEVAR